MFLRILSVGSVSKLGFRGCMETLLKCPEIYRSCMYVMAFVEMLYGNSCLMVTINHINMQKEPLKKECCRNQRQITCSITMAVAMKQRPGSKCHY